DRADVRDPALPRLTRRHRGPAPEVRVLIVGEHLGPLVEDLQAVGPQRSGRVLGESEPGPSRPGAGGELERCAKVAELVVPDPCRLVEEGGLALEPGPPLLVLVAGADAEHEMPA